MRILVDMDDTTTYLGKYVIEKFNAKYNQNLKLDDIKQFDTSIYTLPYTDNMYRDFMNPNIFENEVDFLPYAIQVLDKLMEEHDVYFVTATHPDFVKARHELLQRNLKHYVYKNLITCVDKHLVHGDILIDDGLHNLIGNNSVKWRVVINQPWNQCDKDTMEENRLIRVYDWKAIEEFVKNVEELRRIV